MTEQNKKTNYTYNALNQLISTKDTNGISQSFNYDKRGNLTQLLENGTIKNTYEFSPLNRLTKATNSIGQIANYDYNGLGFRVGKQTADTKLQKARTPSFDSVLCRIVPHCQCFFDFVQCMM